ncbi:UGT76C4 [Symbiodinium sp. CCMP2456]|nr:UGT76C4 [Symbiodinium sp. CCMP2456]
MAFRPFQRALAQRRLRWPGRPGRSLAADHYEDDIDTSGLKAPGSDDAAGGGHDASTKDDDDDHVELMEWQSPWPFLSAADGKLCDLSAGAHWPWKPSMASKLKEISPGVRPQLQSADLSVDAMLAGVGSDVDLAVVARAAADGHQEDLWDWLNDRKAQLKKCNTGSLAAILSSLTRASQTAQRNQTSCRSLLRHVAGEMLQAHRRLSPRHALVMLASLQGEAQGGNTDDDEKPVSANDLLEKVFATLKRKDGDGRLLLAEIVPAMEALAVLRSTTVDAQREQLLSLAKLLVCELHGGLGLSLLLAQSGQSRGGIQSALLRLLAALAHLPEAAGPTAKWLTALGGVRWSREAITSQEVMASAAFTLSRWGAWSSVRTDYLLSQALRRDRVAADRAEEDAELRPYLLEDAELIPASSGSWWLAAIAQSGQDIEGAAGFEVFAEHAPNALFGAVSRLGPDDPSAPKVRALWALHALGKVAEHQELAESLLKQLQEADLRGFSPESWWLLRELQPSHSKEEGEAVESPFSMWKDQLSGSLEAERSSWTSERGDELASLIQELGAAGEDAPEIAFVAGPFCLALHWGNRGKALDLDHHSPVTRVLRRQHWATVLPDVEVKEVSLEEWDEDGGRNRLALLQSFLGGEPPELLNEPLFSERARRISRVMRAQADAVLEKLGPEMVAPEGSHLGAGASVSAALILSSLAKESPEFVFQAVAETTKSAEGDFRQ